VDISTILSELNHDLVAVGSWVNIIGDVKISSSASLVTSTTTARAASASSSKSVQRPAKTSTTAIVVARRTRPRPSLVQATMLWSAGAVDVKDYETAVRQFQVSLRMKAMGAVGDGGGGGGT
jgi:hypothetical protein